MKYDFRADHVGSLLRPRAVKDARAAHAAREISDDELSVVENGAIGEAVALQVEAGLPVVTDGEMRRSFWHYDFLGMLEGFELVERDEGVQFAGVKLRPIYPTIQGKLSFGDHPMLDHYRFLAKVAPTGLTPKISIPGPSCAHFRTAKSDIHPPEYGDVEVLFADIVATYRDALKAFYEAGCRYLQFDDIFFAYLCDPKHRADKVAEGFDPDWLIGKYAEMMDAVIADRPDDLIVGSICAAAISARPTRRRAATTPPRTPC